MNKRTFPDFFTQKFLKTLFDSFKLENMTLLLANDFKRVIYPVKHKLDLEDYSEEFSSELIISLPKNLSKKNDFCFKCDLNQNLLIEKPVYLGQNLVGFLFLAPINSQDKNISKYLHKMKTFVSLLADHFNLMQKMIYQQTGKTRNINYQTFLLNHSKEGMWIWNLNEKSISYSDNWYKITRTKRAKTETLALRYENVHVEDLKKSKDLFNKFLKSEETEFYHEYRILDENNSIKWISEQVKIVKNKDKKDKIYGLITDISQKKMLENLHNQTKANLSTIINSINDSIILMEIDGTIFDVNIKMMEMYGIEYEEAIYLNFENDILAFDYENNNILDLWASVFDSTDVFFETKSIRRNDFSSFYVEVYIKKITFENREILLATLRDISDRKQTEEILINTFQEIQKKNTELEKSNEQIKNSQKAIIELEKKNSIMAMAITANHEINQPLMILQGNLDMLCESMKNALDEKNQNRVKKIKESIERISEILNKFKNLEDINYKIYTDKLTMLDIHKKK